MAPTDVDRVAELEAESFSTPWRADTFRTLLERSAVELWVIEDERTVAGYAVLWCVLDQGELANLAVDESRRGRGLGGRLLDRVLDVARERGVRTLFLEVRVSNEAAQELYASRGFSELGRRKNYYDQPREDARLLEKRL